MGWADRRRRAALLVAHVPAGLVRYTPCALRGSPLGPARPHAHSVRCSSSISGTTGCPMSVRRMPHAPRRDKPPQGVSRAAWARMSLFERKVYQATCGIPKGQTRSYRWVAEQIGHPSAARAVGNALRRNPFAPSVPCHRVVRSDGSLGGYRGGRTKKRALLRQEGWRPPTHR